MRATPKRSMSAVAVVAAATLQISQPESPACVHHPLRVQEVINQRALLFGQGAEDGGGHGFSLKNKGGRGRLDCQAGHAAPRVISYRAVRGAGSCPRGSWAARCGTR